MPELPEVEIIKRGLKGFLKARPSIRRFDFLRPDLRDPLPVAQLRQLEGQKIMGIERRAKYLLFETESGGFLSHLGMTGAWRREAGLTTESKPTLHDHIRIFLSDGQTLVYNDPRRFGVFDILNEKTRHQRLSHLGPEPLNDEFSAASLWQSLRGKATSIKAAIMDQRVVVGVGNIYASEALFMARVRPHTPSLKLSRLRAERLVRAIQQVLTSSIEAGGSTISDYRNAEGKAGAFQTRFSVYDRAGEACVRCAKMVRKGVTGGRSTYWCPNCQS